MQGSPTRSHFSHSLPLARSLPLCLTYLRASAAPLTATEEKPKGLPPVTRRKGKFFRTERAGERALFPERRIAPRSTDRRYRMVGSRRTRNANADEDGPPACWGRRLLRFWFVMRCRSGSFQVMNRRNCLHCFSWRNDFFSFLLIYRFVNRFMLGYNITN